MNYEYTVVLTRVPPGDRWNLDGQVYDTLTDGLNAVFVKTGCTVFLINAKEGTVSIQREAESVPVPPKRFSLYDEN